MVIPDVSEAARNKRPGTTRNKLRTVCSKIIDLPSTMIYKSIASHHITDARARSTSFIGTYAAPDISSACLQVYDGKGNLVHKMGLYQKGFGWRWRFYGGYPCGDFKTAARVAADAEANTGSPAIYIKTSSSQCVKIVNANRCYNSAGC
ncbi:MAG: hypothetical protein K1X83_15570 [Oligoflexia bacterium]|nr:hypothetical protein [Oligoflexia bacterium]